MASRLIELPWDSQPQEAVEVDWSNPLARGLILAANLADGGAAESVSRTTISRADSGSIGRAISSRRGGLLGISGSGAVRSLTASNDLLRLNNVPQTHAGLLRITNLDNPWGGIVSVSDGSTNTCFSFQRFSASGDLAVYINNSQGFRFVSLDSAIVDGEVHAFVFSTSGDISSTANARLTIDGVTYSPSFLENAGSHPGAGAGVSLRLFSERGGSASFGADGDYYAHAAWNRALSDTEARSITANPWQLFEPRRIWVPVSAAGGGGDTTISATPAEASATGVTASISTSTNTTITCSVGAASAVGVTALLNTTLQATPGGAAATGVTARLNTSVNATPAEASATGVTASIAVAGSTVITATPGAAAAAGVTANVNTTLQAAPGTATATGVSTLLPRAISTAPGEAAADGLAAQLHRVFGVTVGDAIAAGVTALVSSATATVGRPVSDASNSGWSASTGSDLFAMVDEITPDAADYIVATSVGAVCELALNGTGYPGTASQVLKFRASSSTGNSVIVRLKNTGGATVRSQTQALTSVDTEYAITLTAPEIAAITSGSLSVELESA